MAARKKAAAPKRKAAPKKKAAAKRKPAAKKAPAKKKAAARKAPARKAPAKKAPAKKAPKATAVKARWSKSQILNEISDAADLSRKQVNDVLEHLAGAIERHIKKGATGEFVLPGLLKINTKRKPAVKARKGINPFTGQEQMFKAKPASTQVKIRPLKRLKDMVG